MVHPNLVIHALTKGADGVLICGCHIGDCHYQEGNLKAEKRADAIRLMLEDFGIEDERFRLEWVSAAEGPRFAQVITEFTEQVKKLGPSPYKMWPSEVCAGLVSRNRYWNSRLLVMLPKCICFRCPFRSPSTSKKTDPILNIV
jgi:coenzyme F420-reducing hydrogenase delta subunit